MHFLHMSHACITAIEAFELPLTSNHYAVEDLCSNSMLRGLVPPEVFLFGESCGASYHGAVVRLDVGFHVTTNTLLSALANDRPS